MMSFQKVIKYLAMAFAVFLVVCIVSSVVYAFTFVGNIFVEDNKDILKNMI